MLRRSHPLNHAQRDFVLFNLADESTSFRAGRKTRDLLTCRLDPIDEDGLRSLAHNLTHPGWPDIRNIRAMGWAVSGRPSAFPTGWPMKNRLPPASTPFRQRGFSGDGQSQLCGSLLLCFSSKLSFFSLESDQLLLRRFKETDARRLRQLT